MDRERQQQEKKVKIERHSMLENISRESRRSISRGRAIPPPISCIGKSGRPGVYFQSYRQDGRFVLREVRIPTQELLHACREDGRLKLQFIQPNDEVHDEAEYEEYDNESFTEDGEQEETVDNYFDDDNRHDNDTNSRDEEN
uniref:FAF domain-containing protein n=1 Tax=Rhizophora mucronata TaxID=61149 RepID=A0A2P2PLR5_RHIMU